MKHNNKPKLNNYKHWLIRLVSKVLTWVHKSFTVKNSKNLNETRDPKVFNTLLRQLDRVITTRGESGLIAYVKAIREQLMVYLSGRSEAVTGIGVTSDGLPKALGDLVPLIRRADSPGFILPFLTTILWCTRALNSGRVPDVSPITLPRNRGSVEELGRYTRKFWSALGMSPRKSVPSGLAFKQYHFTTKSGPNGQAMWSSLSDLYSLPQSLIESICVVGGKKLSGILGVLLNPEVRSALHDWFTIKGGKFRKLSYFPDREAKVRVIAILDYWSQAALRPLHSYLYRVLRKIPQDCTFDQGSFRTKCVDWDEFVSVDLKSATDRFPISVITQVLKGHLPVHYVDHWANIMVGFPFEYNDGKKVSYLSYAVGNPMGAYSSWASFAVANHFVIFYCCQKLGIDWRQARYVLLGDDILIGNFELAEMYIQTIESLGVEVSASKTHWSKHFGEFAKRLLYKGQEISPFPVSAIRETSKRYYLLVNLIMEQERREWSAREGCPEAVEWFYTYVKPTRRKLRRKFVQGAEISELITKVMRGVNPASDPINAIARRLNPHSPEFTVEEANTMLSQCAREMFWESDPTTSSSKDKSLGVLASNALIRMTGDDRFYSILSSAGFEASYLPFLYVYGLVEEQWLKLRRQGLELEDLGSDWPFVLRSMLIPASDEVFVLKSRDLRAQAAASIGRRLEKIVQLRLASLGLGGNT